jgi:hypothetical protein
MRAVARGKTGWTRKMAVRLSVGFVLLFPPVAGHLDLPLTGATPPATLPASAHRESDRTYKLDLLDKLASPPQLIVFGGSRGTRFDPKRLQQRTGLRTFNAAFSNGRPTDAWGFTCYSLQRAPNVKLHCLWAIQPSIFYQKVLDPGLLQDPRLSRYFPQQMLDDAVPDQIAYVALDLPLFWSPGEFIDDGRMVTNWYDTLESQGRTLDQSLRQYIAAQLGSGHGTGQRTSWGLNQRYFAMTLGLFNSVGVTPVLVMMPTHPVAIAGLGAAAWEKKRVRLLHFLRFLQRTYHFVVLDYSRIESFHGDPNAFYDGVHIKKENADRIIDAAVRAAPQAFQ